MHNFDKIDIPSPDREQFIQKKKKRERDEGVRAGVPEGVREELPTVRLIFTLPLGTLPLIWLSVDCVHLEVCVVTIKTCLRLYNKEQSRAWE